MTTSCRPAVTALRLAASTYPVGSGEHGWVDALAGARRMEDLIAKHTPIIDKHAPFTGAGVNGDRLSVTLPAMPVVVLMPQ